MPQALPILPQLPGLDGRAADVRSRPADPVHRSEHRELFDRLLDRFSRADVANDARQDPAKEPEPKPETSAEAVSESGNDDAIDAKDEPAEKDGVQAKDKPADAEASAPQIIVALPAAVTAVQVQTPQAAASAAPVVQPEASMPQAAQVQAAVAAVGGAEKSVEAGPSAPAQAATGATVGSQVPAEVAADDIKPFEVSRGKIATAASAETAGMDKKPALASMAATLPAPAAEQPPERKFDLEALRLQNEPRVDGAQPRLEVKAKGNSANGMAQTAAPPTMREEPTAPSSRSDQPVAAFATDSPRSAAAIYHKIAEAARPAADAPAPAEQLSMRLLHAVADGKRAIQVHLHPAELGSIDIKMQWQGDRLTAQFTVDRPETLQLLQRDIPALERSLNQAGVNVDSGSLQFSLRQQQEQGRSGGQGFAPARGHVMERMDLRASDEPLGQIVREGLLSIRV